MTSGIRLLKREDAVADEIARRIDHVKELKEISIAAAVRFEEEQAELIALIETGANGYRYRAKVVRKDSVVINEAGLKKALGAALFKKITKTVLDRKLLEAKMADGEIDPVVVSANSEVKPQKPYVSFTELRKDSDAE